jgi:hypothetical protein
MTPNRQIAQNFIIEQIGKLAPGGKNKQIYVELFDEMSDEAFDKFMTDLESGESRLAVIVPNFGQEGVSTERNLELAKELGHEFFQRVWIEGTGDMPTYLTPIPYLVVDLPVRRQAQVLIKKISIPEDNKVIDDFTGQPTGRSKGSKMSFPETQVMAAMGLDNCLIEFLKFRGGDIKGFDAMNDSISKTGGVSMMAIKGLAGGVESTMTLKAYLTAMHISSSL